MTDVTRALLLPYSSRVFSLRTTSTSTAGLVKENKTKQRYPPPLSVLKNRKELLENPFGKGRTRFQEFGTRKFFYELQVDFNYTDTYFFKVFLN